MSNKKKFFPLMIDLDNKKVVITGSGKVARRKARFISGYGTVQVVANSFDKKFKQLSNTHSIELLTINIEELSDEQISDILSDAFLVIPATGNAALNLRISTLAKQSGALVNQVDSIAEVIFPSVVTQGDIQIGISTNGNSPALSRFTRKKIEQFITPEYADMARLQNEMREHYKICIDDQEKRKQYLWEILNNEEIWQAFAESYDKALDLAMNIHSTDS